MFAVPGWSVPSDKLKTETLNKPPPQEKGVKGHSTKGTGANATALFAEPAAKKRKREKAAKRESSGPQITSKNLAEMWERVIEKRDPSQRTEGGAPPSKKSRRSKKDKSEVGGETEPATKPNKPAAAQQASKPIPIPTKSPTSKETADRDKAKPAKKAGANARIDNVPVASEKSDQSTQSGKVKDKKEKKVKAAEADTFEHTPKTEKLEHEDKKDKKDKKKREDVQMEDVQTTPKEQTPSKKQKADKLKQDKPIASAAAAAVAAASPAAATAGVLSLPPAGPKLTPLQASMRAKLVSARFRHLNETLYTTPSAEALRLFGESPDMFHAYHEGFRQQVSVWPENPVDGYVAEVRRRAGKGASGGKSGGGGRGRGGRGGRGGFGGHHHRDPTDTLPRTHGQCRLADIGCGDARLAASLAPDAAALRIEVLSFDLHADPNNPFITAAADASDLPLGPGSVDVTVFCLALMGTNWLSFVEEAYRVLRWKGELWVAEIKSRFAGGAEMRARLKQKQQANQKGPVSHSVGFRRKNGIKGGKKAGQDEDDPDVVAAAISEVDGADEGGSAGATDVSAFVQALRRRGFVLDESAAAGEDGQPKATGGKPPAVDLSNKMFVKMRFIKAAPPMVGKEEVMQSLNGGRGSDGGAKKPSVFDDDKNDRNADPMADPALEAKILKPCVYKLR
ncbi:rRNA processing protein [Sporothrix brasiliensis 5110]|uniref:Ribosomal RNA-processing protein 8 n=1 Tax=Sporothrix brasiliensis 5110 TaxID=1398154 RepID=A0A0C2FMN2_9PEZI|nr:rRNA processing protein [Sporothrix brasiliensis 5110]KIH92328.1 rRNA processing protein [Sporothrix brasiliensis 5110]